MNFFTVTSSSGPYGQPPNQMHACWAKDFSEGYEISLSTIREQNLYLGSGSNCPPNVIGLDILKFVKPTVVADMEVVQGKRHLPFRDNQFDVVFSNMTLEHIRNLLPLAEEIWRVMRPGGTFECFVPWWSSFRSWGDPTHVRTFADQSLAFWKKEAYERDFGNTPMGQYRPNCDFEVLLSCLGINEELRRRPQEDIDFWVRHGVNTVDFYWFKLRAIK